VDITVGICTWNRAPALRRTLDQLTRLELPSDLAWELVLVNNNCTDDTDEVARSFAASLPLRYFHEPRAGVTYARNRVVDEARGRVLLWTDDDVLVDPGWVVAMRGALDGFGADWVFGRSEPLWPGEQPRWYSNRLSGLMAALDYGDQPFVVTSVQHPFYGLNVGGTIEAHRQLGGFRLDSGFVGEVGGLGEDIDLFERARSAGQRIVYTPRSRVRHIIPPERTRKQFHRRRQWLANGVVFQHLPELFPGVPTLMSVPRFMYRNALEDGWCWVHHTLRGNRGEAFYHEMQLLRFVRFELEAVRQAFRRPGRPVSPRESPSS